MPLSYMRRPLFLATALYILVLCLLHALGFFEVRAPSGFLRYCRGVSVELRGRVVSPLTDNHRGRRVVLRASSVGEADCDEKVQVYFPKGNQAVDVLRPGQLIEISARLRLPRAARNPGEFDERGFLSERGVTLIAQAESSSILSPPPWPWKPLAWAESFHRSVAARFGSILPEPESSLMTGITLGYKGALPSELNRAIQDAGVMHLLVPSGAKVAFVLMALLEIGNLLALYPGQRLALAAVFGGLYTLAVGAEPPYARAYLGFLAGAAGYFFDRESGLFQGLVLSALLILILEPRALFGAGFQMTYLACAGLLLGMTRFSALLPGRWPSWARKSAQTAFASVVVQVMLWPLFARIFGRGSLVGVGANLLLIPLSFVMMGVGFAAWAGLPLTPALKLLAGLFAAACRAFAALPGAAVDFRPMPWPCELGYYVLAFALLAWPGRRTLVLLACLGAGLIWVGIPSQEAFSVLYFRLPKAQAAVVSFPEGAHWLVLTGGPAGSIVRALKARGIERLDRAVLEGEGAFRALAGVARKIPVLAVQGPGSAPFELCREKACFRFRAPGVLGTEGEFDIIASRLRSGAVEVRVEGGRAEISDAR